MRKVYFVNNGEFDVRTMLTFGISAKEGDNAIGFFGTGFKYAIAIVLRLGGKISVLNGKSNEKFEFTVQPTTVRGKEFAIVQVNGENAGFTTHLGTTWEPWQAYRELRCNAVDEGGKVTCSPEEALCWDVIVSVDCEQIADAHEKKGLYFLEGTPALITKSVEIHDRPSLMVYYRGIAVAQLQKVGAFTYNIKEALALTEDRTAKYSHQWTDPIRRAWMQQVEDRAMLRKALTTSDSLEWELTFQHMLAEPSEAMLATARELMRQGRPVSDHVRAMLRKISEEEGEWPVVELTPVQQRQLEKASQFLRSAGVKVSQFPIHVVDGLGDGVMGRALNGQIYLSPLAFDMGTKQVASTLLEEWVHNAQNCNDFDRRMQSWLFDKILSLIEEKNGEPL